MQQSIIPQKGKRRETKLNFLASTLEPHSYRKHSVEIQFKHLCNEEKVFKLADVVRDRHIYSINNHGKKQKGFKNNNSQRTFEML